MTNRRSLTVEELCCPIREYRRMETRQQRKMTTRLIAPTMKFTKERVNWNELLIHFHRYRVCSLDTISLPWTARGTLQAPRKHPPARPYKGFSSIEMNQSSGEACFPPRNTCWIPEGSLSSALYCLLFGERVVNLNTTATTTAPRSKIEKK